MILELTVKNFRSIKEEQSLSMMADAGKSKIENTFELLPVGSADPLRLLKTAVIYGANASGKSNIMRAFNSLRMVVTQTGKLAVDEEIEWYEPFVFDALWHEQPTCFKLQFIGSDGIRYSYEIRFTGEEIAFEKLDYYPSGYPSNLFERVSNGENVHRVKKGKSLKGRGIPLEIFKNQSYVSKFGMEVPNEKLSMVYLYFSGMVVMNVLNSLRLDERRQKILKEISKPDGAVLRKRLSKLIRVADTRIEAIDTLDFADDRRALNDRETGTTRPMASEPAGQIPVAIHKMYRGATEIGTTALDLDEESAGTNVLFVIGAIILKTLEKGGLIVVDELDNSLHPKLCKFLVRLFHHHVSNQHHAQLVFATHEVTLLDRDVFRKDQIWFVEKDKFGGSAFFQAGDVEGARDDTDFENWYRTGKFGGQPKIKEIEFILGDA